MEILGRGILFGLLLAVMLGPIFIVIINTSLQYGKKAGLLSCLGVWVSDFIYIVVSYFFINQVAEIVNNNGFRFWMSICGGIILASFGVYNLFKRIHFTRNDLKTTEETDLSIKDKSDRGVALVVKSNKEFLISGFLVNSINPFTLFFWLTVMTTEVVGKGLDSTNAFIFILGIISTIMFTDTIKVLLADIIRKRINKKIFTIFVRIAGIGLLIFGLYFLFYGFTL